MRSKIHRRNFNFLVVSNPMDESYRQHQVCEIVRSWDNGEVEVKQRNSIGGDNILFAKEYICVLPQYDYKAEMLVERQKEIELQRTEE